MRKSMASTFLRTSSGDDDGLDRVSFMVSVRVDWMAVLSFSTLKRADLKFLRRSSKGSRIRGWSCPSG
jgi:hypothetical protein